MSYLSRILPVIAILLALGGAIYYVLSEQPRPADSSATQPQAAATPKSLVPPGYANKSS